MNIEYDNLQVYFEDCVEGMKKRIRTASVQLILTDPPYGIAFMGKKWDKALPDKEAFKKMYRVLKAGGLAFAAHSAKAGLNASQRCNHLVPQWTGWVRLNLGVGTCAALGNRSHFLA